MFLVKQSFARIQIEDLYTKGMTDDARLQIQDLYTDGDALLTNQRFVYVHWPYKWPSKRSFVIALLTFGEAMTSGVQIEDLFATGQFL